MRLGEGNDELAFTRGIVVGGDIRVRFEGGANSVSMQDATAMNLRAYGDGAQRVLLRENAVVTNDVHLKFREGNDVVVVDGATIGDDLIVKGGHGINTTNVENAMISGDFVVRGGRDRDDVVVRASTIGDDIGFSTSSGDDFVLLDSNQIAEGTKVRLGAHDDYMILEGTNDLGRGLKTNGNSGSDSVEIGEESVINLRQRTKRVESSTVPNTIRTNRLDGELRGADTRRQQVATKLDDLLSAGALGLVIGTTTFSESDGIAATGTISVSEAPVRDLVVTLTSSDTSEVTVPDTVTVAAGSTSATFDVTAVDDSTPDGTQTVTIGIEADRYDSASQVLTIEDNDVLTLSIDTSTIAENAGADAISATLTRASATDAALVVNLVSSDETEVAVPANVTIPAGEASVTFGISVVDDDIGDGIQTVTVNASQSSHSESAVTVSVEDDDEFTFAIDTTSLDETAGDAGTGTVSITGIATADVIVTLTSSDTTEVTVPAEVTIPAGQASATFVVTAVDDSEADGDQTATITAAVNGFSDLTVDVTIVDNERLDLAIDVTDFSEAAGDAATGTVVRQNSDGDLVVSLSSSDTTAATVPETVTILDGETSTTFLITAVDDNVNDGSQRTTIQASADNLTSDAVTVTVTDDDILTLSVDVTEFSEGDGANVAVGTVTRQSNTDNDLVVSLLNSDSSEVSIPTSVTILAGQTIATFDISAVDDDLDDGSIDVLITADEAGHTGASVTLTVTDTNDLFLSVAPTTVREDGGAGVSTGTVTRQGNTAEALTVTLTSSDTDKLATPPSIEIPAGQSFVTFSIDAVDGADADLTQVIPPYRKSFGFDGPYVNAFHAEMAATRRSMYSGPVAGSLRVADALKLYELAYFSRGDILELGSYHGLSAWIMARALSDAGLPHRVYSVDLSARMSATARANIEREGLGARVAFLTAEAAEGIRQLAAGGRRFATAFVDHSHGRDHVLSACLELPSVLTEGAPVAFHDYNDRRNPDPAFPEYGVIQGVAAARAKIRLDFRGIYGCLALFQYHAGPPVPDPLLP